MTTPDEYIALLTRLANESQQLITLLESILAQSDPQLSDDDLATLNQTLTQRTALIHTLEQMPQPLPSQPLTAETNALWQLIMQQQTTITAGLEKHTESLQNVLQHSGQFRQAHHAYQLPFPDALPPARDA